MWRCCCPMHSGCLGVAALSVQHALLLLAAVGCPGCSPTTTGRRAPSTISWPRRQLCQPFRCVVQHSAAALDLSNTQHQSCCHTSPLHTQSQVHLHLAAGGAHEALLHVCGLLQLTHVSVAPGAGRAHDPGLFGAFACGLWRQVCCAWEVDAAVLSAVVAHWEQLGHCAPV